MQKIFYIPNENTPSQGIFVAVHEEGQNVENSAYGENVKSFFIEDVRTLARVGTPPASGFYDNRDIVIPNFNNDSVLRESARKDMLNRIQVFGDSIIAKYSDAERQSWASKEAAARAFLAGTPLDGTQEQILQAEQTTGGYPDRESLVKAIIEKAEQFGRIAGGISGLRNTISTKIDNAKNQNDIDMALTELDTELLKLLQPA